MSQILDKFPIQSISIDSKDYPNLLRQIPDAPKTLYFRGSLFSNNALCFAIVGARKCSDYGKEIAFSFASELAQNGLTIVSGMARGIDTFSHCGAIEGASSARSISTQNGSVMALSIPTIAILGTGLDEKSIYPQENIGLAKKILEQNGALISEYPEKTFGSPFTFPRRNRIISAISLGILVVEAKTKSGALNTAFWAKKQNKQIFAIPGSIYSQNSKGCHLLIKKGTQIAETPQEILKSLGIKANLTNKNSNTSANQTEQIILEILKQGACHIDKIIVQSKLPAPTISSAISMLELNDKVKNLGGNAYIIKN